MNLRSLWKSIRLRLKPRQSVALDPVEQLAMRYLLRFGSGTAETIYADVSATRVTSHVEVGQALARLVSEGLVESRLRVEGDQSETVFLSSRRGARLRGRIPPEPKGVLEFYL